jgi:type IV pilus assembly protein PilP
MPPAQVNQLDFSTKKDPFKPFISVKSITPAELAKQKRELKPTLPLHSFDVSQFRLIGTVVDSKGNKAMVVDPSQKGYVLKVGMTIGKNEGKIVRIDPNGVDVVEQFRDDNNKVRKETIRIPLLRKP